MYEGGQTEIHQVGEFDESNAVSTTYLRKVNMTREDVLRQKNNFQLQISSK